jgi:hypothetical protein
LFWSTLDSLARSRIRRNFSLAMDPMLKHTYFTALKRTASQGRVNRYRRGATSIDPFTKRIVALIITQLPATSLTTLTSS